MAPSRTDAPPRPSERMLTFQWRMTRRRRRVVALRGVLPNEFRRADERIPPNAAWSPRPALSTRASYQSACLRMKRRRRRDRSVVVVAPAVFMFRPRAGGHTDLPTSSYSSPPCFVSLAAHHSPCLLPCTPSADSNKTGTMVQRLTYRRRHSYATKSRPLEVACSSRR
jgi:hypothetical protein